MFSALPPAIPTQGSSWSPSQPGSPALPSNLGPFQRPARPQRPSGSPTSHLWAWLCSNCLLGAPLLLLRGSQFSVALGGQNRSTHANVHTLPSAHRHTLRDVLERQQGSAWFPSPSSHTSLPSPPPPPPPCLWRRKLRPQP